MKHVYSKTTAFFLTMACLATPALAGKTYTLTGTLSAVSIMPNRCYIAIDVPEMKNGYSNAWHATSTEICKFAQSAYMTGIPVIAEAQVAGGSKDTNNIIRLQTASSKTAISWPPYFN